VKRLLVLAICLIALSVVSGGYLTMATEQKIAEEFYDAFPCEKLATLQPRKGVCIERPGLDPRREQFTLLGEQNFCLGFASEKVKEYEGVVDVTELSLSSECADPETYFLAVVRISMKDYKFIELKRMIDLQKIQLIHETILEKKLLDDVAERFYKDSTPLPDIYEYPIPGMNVMHAQYNYWGPTILLFDGSPKRLPVRGTCLVKEVKVFRINTHYYLYAWSCRCETDDCSSYIFNIQPSGLVEVKKWYSGL
jgi:hypothetical protein